MASRNGRRSLEYLDGRALRRFRSERIRSIVLAGEARVASGDEPVLGDDDLGAAFTAQMQAAIDDYSGDVPHHDLAQAGTGELVISRPDGGAGEHEQSTVGSSVIRPTIWRVRSSYMDQQHVGLRERRLAARSRVSDDADDAAAAALHSENTLPDANFSAEICRLESDAGAVTFYLAGAEIFVQFEGALLELDLGKGPLVLEPALGDRNMYRVVHLSLDELDAAMDAFRRVDGG